MGSAPVALTPAIVERIWIQAHELRGMSSADAQTMAGYVNGGTLKADDDVLREFVRLAIAAPHHAGVLNISDAVGAPRQKINRIKMSIVNDDRAERDADA